MMTMKQTQKQTKELENDKMDPQRSFDAIFQNEIDNALIQEMQENFCDDVQEQYRNEIYLQGYTCIHFNSL